MKKGRVGATFDDAYTRTHRTFPKGMVALLILVLIVQVGVILLACSYDPKPQDVIREYDVTVTALEDGSLDIAYRFVWEALDTSEELTWIEIGMANPNYTVYPESVSSTIRQYTQEDYDGEVYLVLDLDRAYTGGEVLEFSFAVNQRDMLCQNSDGYFYEFVPGWFNATPVEQYTFRWANDGRIRILEGADLKDGWFTLSGSLKCGEYVAMSARYGQDSFAGCDTVMHWPFDGYACDELQEGKIALIVVACLVAAALIFVQVYIVDSFVSYHRGRGFLTGHGYHVHTYGRSNPHYIRARDKYNATHARSHGRGGGGCACACACACAGGGRAGCSQKDTFGRMQNDEC